MPAGLRSIRTTPSNLSLDPVTFPIHRLIWRSRYEENSCNYNGISYFCATAIGYMLNATRTMLPESIRDVFVHNYANGFIPSGPNAGCMPGWGGSNTACENTGQWGPVFEMMGALYQSPALRYGASLLMGANPTATLQWDPNTYMLAHRWKDSSVPIRPSPLTTANVGWRRSPGYGSAASLEGDEHAVVRPDKLVLTRNATVVAPFVANSSSDASMPGWVMMEIFATTTLYHAVPTLPGHIIHFTANGSLFLDSPRKHWPHSAQGNQLVIYPKQKPAALAAQGKRVFPWYSAQQIITPGGEWQLASVPTRFLGAQSNDAKFMTQRRMQQDSFGLVCMGRNTYNSTGTRQAPDDGYAHGPYDVFIDQIALVGPGGKRTIDDFESGASAWSDATIVSGGANGSKSALKIACAGNSSSASRRPHGATPTLDGLSFDTVEDYDHLIFYFKVSASYSNSPLSQDFPFAINATTSHGNAAPFGRFQDRHVGTDGGNLHSNAVCGVDELSNQVLGENTNDNSIWMPTILNVSASGGGGAAGDVGGGVRMEHSFFRGSKHDRVLVLLEEDVLIVYDRVVAPDIEGGVEAHYVGPVFNVRSGLAPSAAGAQTLLIKGGFEGTDVDQQLAVWFASSASGLEVGSTGPCGGGANPSPDACRVDAPQLNPAAQSAGAFSQVFSFAEIPSGAAAGFVSVLAPVGGATEARRIAQATAKFSADGASVVVELLGKKVSIQADGEWTASAL